MLSEAEQRMNKIAVITGIVTALITITLDAAYPSAATYIPVVATLIFITGLAYGYKTTNFEDI